MACGSERFVIKKYTFFRSSIADTVKNISMIFYSDNTHLSSKLENNCFACIVKISNG